MPVQGHSRICEVAARIVAQLQPRIVIPHHHDDFLPPLSTCVDLRPFVAALRELSPRVEVVCLPRGQPFAPW
jgi:L-ascorbate metabolism protein UlaG (beta-lactamase superfamily)